MESYIIFLKIEVLFIDSDGYLHIEQPVVIDNDGSTYTITQEGANREMRISGVFTCTTQKKKVEAFMGLDKSYTICIETEANNKIKDFFKEYYEKCSNELNRLYKLLRWQYSLGNKQMRHGSKKSYWSADNNEWHQLTHCFDIVDIDIQVTDDWEMNVQMIKNMMASYKEEPIYHELLRVVNDLKSINIRTAYIIAVSALEVAVKIFIKHHAPQTKWLLDNTQSPDVPKLIESYFPILVPGYKTLDKKNSNILKSIIATRNNLIHTGLPDIPDIEMYERIEFLKTLILNIDRQVK